MSLMRRIIIVFILFIVKINSVFAQEAPSSNILRVAIINQASSLELSLKGLAAIKPLYAEELIDTVNSLRSAQVLPLLEGIRIGERVYKVFGIRIQPQKDASILVNNRRYRGEIDIVRTKELRLLVINRIPIEEYLYGVLYHEVSHRWPIEVLKAQAIASRTYALYQKSVSPSKDYDLTADFYSQVYGGRTSEKYRATKAVNLTRGQVLTYKGKIFPAYFHATCGGATEDASELWNINLPPLKGVKCDYCWQSPHYRWERFISSKEMREKLTAAGYGNTGKILAIVGSEKNASARLRNLHIVSDKGNLKISAKDFRQLFNPLVIRSTNFETEVAPDGVVFQGYGWGHGVGLCQWGAYFMALKRYKVDEILKFYYPGAEITTLDKLIK